MLSYPICILSRSAFCPDVPLRRLIAQGRGGMHRWPGPSFGVSDRLLGHAHLGEPMITRVPRRMPVTALSPEAVRRDRPAAGRLLVSSRHACSVVRLSRATTRAPGSSWYSHPAAVATSCQVRATGPEMATVTVSPGPAEHCLRR